MHKATLDFQISVGHPVAVYCPECFWSASNPASRYCAYGHGAMTAYTEPLQAGEPEPVNKIEEMPEKVYTECPTLPLATFPAIDPTGTPVLQQCMGCGYQAVEAYPATCPTCRNPYPVSMVLGVTWPELLRIAQSLKKVVEELQAKQEVWIFPPEPDEFQLNLFGT